MTLHTRCLSLFLTLSLLLPLLPIPVVFAVSAPDTAVKTDSVMVKYKTKYTAVEVRLRPGENVASAIERLSSDPAVEYAEPNYIYKASLQANDPQLSSQWYLRRVRATEAWSVRSVSPQVVIAIIDSGVQVNHPDLKDNIWVNTGEIPGNGKDDDRDGFIDDINGWDFVNNVADPAPKFNPGYTEAGILHGTIVAGVAAARGNNQEGIAGITWQSRIMPLKALDDEGDGSTNTVIRAIDYAVAKGANIINLSFVGFGFSRSFRDALQRARNAGVIVVAPAGNEVSNGSGTNLNTQPIYPACYRDDNDQPLVVGVAATDGVDQKTSFSGYGNNCISLSAPGISFYSTSVYAPAQSIDGKIFNKYYDGYWSGTSVAVPLVSGGLALVLGANPNLSARQAVKILTKTTDNIDGANPDYVGQLGSGRLNVFKAVTEAAAGPQSIEPVFAIAPAGKDSPNVRLTDATNQVLREFTVYTPSFKGGLNLAAGDINGDGSDELVIAPVSNLEADIRIYDQFGNFQSHFLAYPKTFRGGVNIAVADVTGDGKAEIITAPKAGIRSDIKVFSPQGKLIRSFLAYPESFRGGATVAVGDVMNDETPEIVTGTGPGGVPQVKVFSVMGKKLSEFVADKTRTPTGLNLLLLDLDGNARRLQSEIVVTRQSGPATVTVFDYRGVVRSTWSAYEAKFRGNVRTAAADLDADGLKEILTVPAAGGGPLVRTFDRLGQFRSSFYAYSPAFTGGVSLAILSIKR